jgi:hypothetical protein
MMLVPPQLNNNPWEPQRHLLLLRYTIFDQHIGNSTIFYCIKEKRGCAQKVFGQISHIFTMPISKKKDSLVQIQLWFQVNQFKNLTPHGDQKTHQFDDWTHVRAHIVHDTRAKIDVIQINAIIGHRAVLELPHRCFGIKGKALAVVNLSKKASN